MRPERQYSPGNIRTVISENRLWLFDTSWLPEGTDFSLPLLLQGSLGETFYAVDSSKRIWITTDYYEDSVAHFKGVEWPNKKDRGKLIYSNIFVSPDQRFCIAIIRQHYAEYEKLTDFLGIERY